MYSSFFFYVIVIRMCTYTPSWLTIEKDLSFCLCCFSCCCIVVLIMFDTRVLKVNTKILCDLYINKLIQIMIIYIYICIIHSKNLSIVMKSNNHIIILCILEYMYVRFFMLFFFLLYLQDNTHCGVWDKDNLCSLSSIISLNEKEIECRVLLKKRITHTITARFWSIERK